MESFALFRIVNPTGPRRGPADAGLFDQLAANDWHQDRHDAGRRPRFTLMQRSLEMKFW